MNICILGATGKSGRRLVRAALDRGHAVTAIVRDPSKPADLAQARRRRVARRAPAQEYGGICKARTEIKQTIFGLADLTN